MSVAGADVIPTGRPDRASAAEQAWLEAGFATTFGGAMVAQAAVGGATSLERELAEEIVRRGLRGPVPPAPGTGLGIGVLGAALGFLAQTFLTTGGERNLAVLTGRIPPFVSARDLQFAGSATSTMQEIVGDGSWGRGILENGWSLEQRGRFLVTAGQLGDALITGRIGREAFRAAMEQLMQEVGNAGGDRGLLGPTPPAAAPTIAPPVSQAPPQGSWDTIRNDVRGMAASQPWLQEILPDVVVGALWSEMQAGRVPQTVEGARAWLARLRGSPETVQGLIGEAQDRWRRSVGSMLDDAVSLQPEWLREPLRQEVAGHLDGEIAAGRVSGDLASVHRWLGNLVTSPVLLSDLTGRATAPFRQALGAQLDALVAELPAESRGAVRDAIALRLEREVEAGRVGDAPDARSAWLRNLPSSPQLLQDILADAGLAPPRGASDPDRQRPSEPGLPPERRDEPLRIHPLHPRPPDEPNEAPVPPGTPMTPYVPPQPPSRPGESPSASGEPPGEDPAWNEGLPPEEASFLEENAASESERDAAAELLRQRPSLTANEALALARDGGLGAAGGGPRSPAGAAAVASPGDEAPDGAQALSPQDQAALDQYVAAGLFTRAEALGTIAANPDRTPREVLNLLALRANYGVETNLKPPSAPAAASAPVPTDLSVTDAAARPDLAAGIEARLEEAVAAGETSSDPRTVDRAQIAERILRDLRADPAKVVVVLDQATGAVVGLGSYTVSRNRFDPAEDGILVGEALLSFAPPGSGMAEALLGAMYEAAPRGVLRVRALNPDLAEYYRGLGGRNLPGTNMYEWRGPPARSAP